MKRLGLLIAILVVCSGCATHYHKQHVDSVALYLKAPNAKNVQFVSSLDAFQRHPAQKVDYQIWEVNVPVVAEFKYFYIVDGSVHIPDCRFRERDDFGSENCLFQPEM